MVKPSYPAVWGRRKTRAPPSTSGSTSKSSSHTPRSRRCFGRRVRNRSVGSSRWPSADTTKSGIDPTVNHPVGTVQRRSRQGRSSRAQRWTQRPPGSTWGDWGDDDELGRINLLTSEKVLAGVREVEAGISFCLSLPLDFPGGTALNQRRHPPVVAPTEDMDGNAATFYNVHMSEMKDFGDPKYVDVWADDVGTLSLQYSTQWDSLAHVGAEFDADGDGVEEAVYYNGYRAGVDLVGPSDDARGDGTARRSFAHQRGLAHLACPGVPSPPPSAWRTWRSTACRAAACSSTPRITSATSGAASTARRSRRSWRR